MGRGVRLSSRGAREQLLLCVVPGAGLHARPAAGRRGRGRGGGDGAEERAGLPVKVQQALDTVRVVGNNAVHPGQLDLRDDIATATSLFGLVNLIAEVLISQPKHVEEMYRSLLPESQRDAIDRRDK